MKKRWFFITCAAILLLILGLFLHRTAPSNIIEYDLRQNMLYLKPEDIPRLSEQCILQYSPDHFTEKDEIAFSCIATLDSGETALYAEESNTDYYGIICTKSGCAQYFSWQYQTPREVPPQLIPLPDGTTLCILNSGAGSGIHLEELHWLQVEKNTITDTSLLNEDITLAFKSAIQNEMLSDNQLVLQIEDTAYPITLPDEYDVPLTLLSVTYGENYNKIVYEDGLYIRAAIELHTEEQSGIIFAGTMQAKIIPDKAGFQITEYCVISEI